MRDNNEWNKLINEVNDYPDELDNVENRFEKRIRREKLKVKSLYSSISFVAASLLFVILVNMSTAFANVVAEIPIIGRLVDYVKFDKGLKSAIENKYAQALNLVAYDGDEKLFLPYVIADEKNLILFYKLPEEFEVGDNEWINIKLNNIVDRDTKEEIREFSYSFPSLSKEGIEENHGFIMHKLNFEKDNLCKSIEIEVVLEKEILGNAEEKGIHEDHKSNSTFEEIGTFKFQIDLNDFMEPIIYEVNKTYTVMGQEINVDYMKIYPTETEVKFSFPQSNTAWIKGLYLEVDYDSKILSISDGISGTHGEEDNWYKVFIESNYFEQPEKQHLFIKGIRLLPKDEEYITVDLNEGTITPVIGGMELKNVDKVGDKANLIFNTKIYDDDMFGMFASEYKDDEGNIYTLNGEGNSITGGESVLETRITVNYPKSGKIILKRSLTPKYPLKPIVIEIKK